MCGIVCLCGKDAGKDCFTALKKLEYRGYDSAGMAGLKDGGIVCHKEKGRVQNLEGFALNFDASLVIAHTRWATHGQPSQLNAHPHLAFDGSLALVHNGIIENYQQLKKDLEKRGITSVSQTDTEVAANLIAAERGSPLKKVRSACQKMVGSFAFGVLFKDEGVVIGTRRGSPLYFARTNCGDMLSSDIVCFMGKANQFYAIKEGEFLCMGQSFVQLYNADLEPIDMVYEKLDKDETSISLNGYDSYMEKEIHDIPPMLSRLAQAYLDGQKLKDASRLFEGKSRIVLVGCGTAYHASMFGAKVLGEALGLPAHAYIASELKYSKEKFKDTIAIFVSQSGETADTLGCVNIFAGGGNNTVAITNVEHSALARSCQMYLPVMAGVELAVASTKAYVAQIMVLYMLSLFLTGRLCEKLLAPLGPAAEQVIKSYDKLVELLLPAQRVFFIGRGYDSITSLEAALKLKEITYKSAEGYPAGELKHGTIALIERGTPVVIFATNDELFEKTMASAKEVKSRGAVTVLVSPRDGDCDICLKLPHLDDEVAYSLISIIPFQILSYKVCTGLGLDADKPRNLAKSVTVE